MSTNAYTIPHFLEIFYTTLLYGETPNLFYVLKLKYEVIKKFLKILVSFKLYFFLNILKMIELSLKSAQYRLYNIFYKSLISNVVTSLILLSF